MAAGPAPSGSCSDLRRRDASLAAWVLINETWYNFAVWGNDTGDIIPWSPAVDDVYREVANEHCAIYKKTAHITSVRHDYGEFIGFECLDTQFDPIKGRGMPNANLLTK